jgi:hypothetical protein
MPEPKFEDDIRVVPFPDDPTAITLEYRAGKLMEDIPALPVAAKRATPLLCA